MKDVKEEKWKAKSLKITPGVASHPAPHLDLEPPHFYPSLPEPGLRGYSRIHVFTFSTKLILIWIRRKFGIPNWINILILYLKTKGGINLK